MSELEERIQMLEDENATLREFAKSAAISVEQLWKILISDNSVDQYESNLMRRICGLIYFSDKDSGEIRMRLSKNK